MQVDLVVIGAGLAGSCIAAAAARQGYQVVLVERRQGSQHKVCGEFLSPEAQASLAALGLHATVAALAPAEITKALLVSRHGLRLPIALAGTAWGVSRRALDAALSDAAGAAGAQVQEGVTALAVEHGSDGYTATVRNAEGEHSTLEARAVIGAYGRHTSPTLRPRVHAVGSASTHVGVKCHYSGVNIGPEVRLFLFDGGYIGLSPIENGHANLCLLATQDAFRRAGASIAGMFAAAICGNPRLANDLAGGTLVAGSEVAVAPVDTGLVPAIWDEYARVGDAVAMIPPLCGDGMAMAIRSAELCAPLALDFLAGRSSLADWEQAYRTAWQSELSGPLRTGRRLQAMLSLPWANDGLLGAGKLLPAAAERLMLATRVRP